ncbi:MAG: LPS export ABC transporter ATP-binding protein [Gemmataceae bacterium]
MAILEVRGLVKYYGRRKVVDGVCFQVDAGEVVGLLGPNGAGKTTSFRMTTGQVVPDDGTVQFNGEDVTDWPMYRRARLGMGYLSQESSVFRKLSVEQNILAILEALPICRSLGRKLRRNERWDRTDAVLEQFGLTHIRKNSAARISGGEKRRLEIARCLVCEPNLILLDEPFAAVDPLTNSDIQKIIRELARQGIGILLTDHNVRDVLKITHRSYLIKDGQVLIHGTPKEIIHDPVAIRNYLGDTFEDYVPAAHTRTETTPPLDMDSIIEGLKDNAKTPAIVTELVRRGGTSVPLLLELMERRDLELRRRSFLVLQHICGPAIEFDPYAPEAQRRQQVNLLREGLSRKAG